MEKLDYTVKKLSSKMILSQMEFVEELGVSFATFNPLEIRKHDPIIKAKGYLNHILENK